MKTLQGPLVCGELLLLMRQAGGKTGRQWRIWILLSGLVSEAGNFCTLVTFRYLLTESVCTLNKSNGSSIGEV